MIDLAYLVLGGGEATRLPGKLALDAGDLPMIARVYDNVRGCDARREIVISGKATFAAGLDALLAAPLVIDRWERRGPLGGMLASMAQIRARFVFVVAGDAPFVDAAFAARLASAYVHGDEALVPVHDRDGTRQIEPLAAIYDRLAFARAGMPVLRAGRGAIRAVIEALRARYVDVDDPNALANVNTPDDYAAFRQRIAHPSSPAN